MIAEVYAVAVLFCFWLAFAASALNAAQMARRGRENRPKWRRYYGGLAIAGHHGAVAAHLDWRWSWPD